MNAKELKQLAAQFGSVVVLQDDRPSFVVLSFEKYQELLDSSGGEVIVKHFSKLSNGFPEANLVSSSAVDENKFGSGEEVERLNKEILALKEEIRAKEEQEPNL